MSLGEERETSRHPAIIMMRHPQSHPDQGRTIRHESIPAIKERRPGDSSCRPLSEDSCSHKMEILIP